MKHSLRIVLFATLVLAYPLLNNLAEIVEPKPIPGYEDDPYSYYFWVGKSLATIALIAMWQLSNGFTKTMLYRVGFYILFLFAFLEFWLVIPTPSGDSYGWPAYMVFTILFGVPLAVLGKLFLQWLRNNRYDKLEAENALLLNRVLASENTLQEIRTESIKRIAIAHAQQMELLNNCHSMKDVILYESILQQKSDEILNELKSIKTKTLN